MRRLALCALWCGSLGLVPSTPPRPTAAARRRDVSRHGIAGFAKVAEDPFWGADTYRIVSCPPARAQFDHVLVDANQFVHVAVRRARTEEQAVAQLFYLLDGVLRVASPRKSLVLALDGAAPLAKLVRQRERRDADYLKRDGAAQKGIDSLLITPGTPLMDVVSEALVYYAWDRLQRRGSLENVTVFVSGVRRAGEGEIKLVQWLRELAPRRKRGTAALVSGDADVVLQSLASLALGADHWNEIEPTVLRPFARPLYGVFSSWALARSLATEFPTAALARTRDDVLMLLLLRGNDYVPKLRGANFRACVEAYTASVRSAKMDRKGSELDLDHFFDYSGHVGSGPELNWPFLLEFFRLVAARKAKSWHHTGVVKSKKFKREPLADDEADEDGEADDDRTITFSTQERLWRCTASRAAPPRGPADGAADDDGAADGDAPNLDDALADDNLYAEAPAKCSGGVSESKLEARRIAALALLARLLGGSPRAAEDAARDGDGGSQPVQALRVLFPEATFAFEATSAPLWSCCVTDNGLNVRRGADTKKAAKSGAVAAMDKLVASRSAVAAVKKDLEGKFISSSTTEIVAAYLRGLLWSAELYVTANCADMGFRYAHALAPSAHDVAEFIAGGGGQGFKPARFSKSRDAPAASNDYLDADTHCAAVMPRTAAELVPDRLGALHKALRASDALYDVDQLRAISKKFDKHRQPDAPPRTWTTLRRDDAPKARGAASEPARPTKGRRKRAAGEPPPPPTSQLARLPLEPRILEATAAVDFQKLQKRRDRAHRPTPLAERISANRELTERRYRGPYSNDAPPGKRPPKAKAPADAKAALPAKASALPAKAKAPRKAKSPADVPAKAAKATKATKATKASDAASSAPAPTTRRRTKPAKPPAAVEAPAVEPAPPSNGEASSDEKPKRRRQTPAASLRARPAPGAPQADGPPTGLV